MAVVEVEAAAVAEAEEISEARVGEGPEKGPEKPEVTKGCGCAVKRICRPVTSVWGKHTHNYGGDGPPHGTGPYYLQELAPVRIV